MSTSDNSSTQSDFTIFTIANCPYCDKAKELLRTTEYSVYEIAVDLKPSLGKLVVLQTGLKTWPQIFHGDYFVGGYTELEEYL